MSESELDQIRAAAERGGLTVAAWVRGVLREARDRERTGAARLREPSARYGADSPTVERVRIELELKPDLLDAVRVRYHLPSRRAAVEFALRRVAVQPMSRDEALGMQGVGWEGDLDAQRSGDPGALW